MYEGAIFHNHTGNKYALYHLESIAQVCMWRNQKADILLISCKSNIKLTSKRIEVAQWIYCGTDLKFTKVQKMVDNDYVSSCNCYIW